MTNQTFKDVYLINITSKNLQQKPWTRSSYSEWKYLPNYHKILESFKIAITFKPAQSFRFILYIPTDTTVKGNKSNNKYQIHCRIKMDLFISVILQKLTRSEVLQKWTSTKMMLFWRHHKNVYDSSTLMITEIDSQLLIISLKSTYHVKFS